MKRKRIVSVFLCLVLAAALLGSAAYANDGIVTGSYQYCPSFGSLMTDKTNTFTYSDDWFAGSAYRCTGELALGSMEFTLASFGSAKTEPAEVNKNQIDYLQKTGFTDYDCNEGFVTTPGYNTIGAGAARKTVTDSRGTATFIALGLRGHNYYKEWGGNVNLGAQGDHAGFTAARDQALDFLRSYIAEQHITGRIKLWITGYSRSAIVANLLGGCLDQGTGLGNVSLAPEDLYVYCYEPPTGTVAKDTDAPVYGNIHNFLNPYDVVARVPLPSWGFSRYGVVHYLPCASWNDDYAARRDEMLKTYFGEYVGNTGPYFIDLFQMISFDPSRHIVAATGKKVTQVEYYDMLEEALVRDVFPTRDSFLPYQDDLVELLAIIRGNGLSDYAGGIRAGLERLSSDPSSLMTALVSGDAGGAADLLAGYLVDGMKDAGVTEYDAAQFKALIGNLIPVLAELAQKDPDITATLLVNILPILTSHEPEVNISWIKTLPAEYFETASALRYDDVFPSDWFYAPVEYVSERGIMTGTAPSRFEPQLALSRAMLVQILYALEGRPSGGSSAGFPDVPGDAWFADAVNWAKAHDIAGGYPDGTFHPEEAVTREQLAVILRAYAGESGSGDLGAFTDAGMISGWAKDAVAWAVGTGLIAGRSGRDIAPKSAATRAEVAQIMTNFCRRYGK